LAESDTDITDVDTQKPHDFVTVKKAHETVVLLRVSNMMTGDFDIIINLDIANLIFYNYS